MQSIEAEQGECVLEWPVAQGQPPHLKSCKGFGDLEQVMGELCS